MNKEKTIFYHTSFKFVKNKCKDFCFIVLHVRSLESLFHHNKLKVEQSEKETILLDPEERGGDRANCYPMIREIGRQIRTA